MTSDRRAWQRFTHLSVRVGVFVGLSVLTVGLAWASTMSWPTVTRTAEPAVVTPAFDTQRLVCAGALRTQTSATDVSAGELIGTAQLMAVGTAGAGVISSSVTGDALLSSAGSDGLFEVGSVDDAAGAVRVESSSLAPDTRIAAAQLQAVASDAISGLVATACARPSLDTWVVGVSTATGHSSYLRLVNTGGVDSAVAVTVATENGGVGAAASYAVAAGAEVTVPLASIAGDATAVALHIVASGAPVTAFVQESIVTGITPTGVDLRATTTEMPANSVSIPGVVVGDSGQVDVSAYASGSGSASIVAIPAGDQAGGASTVAELVAGAVASATLSDLEPGPYVIRIQADTAVVAGARTTNTADDGIDFALYGGVSAVHGDALIAVPAIDGLTARLVLFAELDTAVRITSADGAVIEVSLAAAVPQSVDVAAGAYAFESDSGVSAAIALSAPSGSATIPLLGSSVTAGSVTVVP